MIIEIPLKLPSLNDYIRECRTNAYNGARMKKQYEERIAWFLGKLPTYEKPIKLHFHWVETTKKRDPDNIAFGKKFILDAMQSCGIIKNDNCDYIKGLKDTFEYGGKDNKIILTITEVENDTNSKNSELS